MTKISTLEATITLVKISKNTGINLGAPEDFVRGKYIVQGVGTWLGRASFFQGQGRGFSRIAYHSEDYAKWLEPQQEELKKQNPELAEFFEVLGLFPLKFERTNVLVFTRPAKTLNEGKVLKYNQRKILELANKLWESVEI